MSVLVTGPGIYDGLDESAYHEDASLAPSLGRSLSSTGAKTILDCPARFAWERDHPRVSSAAQDLGSVAHHLILHRGGRLIIVDARDWKKPANQKIRDNGRDNGIVVVHRGELQQAAAMARSVRHHQWSLDGTPVGTVADTLLTGGEPEISLYWIDAETGVTCRGRIDYLHPRATIDVKTAVDASPAGFAKACVNFGYREQAAYYSAGVEALTGERRPFWFLVVEKAPPHLVAIYGLSEEDLDWGASRMREALRTFAACESSGDWPAYSADVVELNMPRWAR